jgi:NTP pyrophosphatase (non-canonical NTP hydrolase)
MHNMENFRDILNIARENIRNNPSLQGRGAEEIVLQYLGGLKDEVEEVRNEIKVDNRIHLEDELSDIAWDYACVLAQLEYAGYIESTEAVIAHGLSKYSERAPAFLESDEGMWDTIKAKQKAELKKRHEELYGN